MDCQEEFERLGCHGAFLGALRLIPEVLFNDSNLQSIDELICKCAEQTRFKGYRVFAVQKGGESEMIIE